MTFNFSKILLLAASLMLTCVFTFAPMHSVHAAPNAKDLYSSCKGCHGSDGSRPALGVGAPLKGQSAAALEKKMAGYKAGTYGGKKKAMMVKFMKGLSDSTIKSLAEYIATLK